MRSLGDVRRELVGARSGSLGAAALADLLRMSAPSCMPMPAGKHWPQHSCTVGGRTRVRSTMSTVSSHTAMPPQPMTARTRLELGGQRARVGGPGTRPATAASVMQPPLRRSGSGSATAPLQRQVFGGPGPDGFGLSAPPGRPLSDLMIRALKTAPQTSRPDVDSEGARRDAGIGVQAPAARDAPRRPAGRVAGAPLQARRRRRRRWGRRGRRARRRAALQRAMAAATASSSKAAATRAAGMPAASARRSTPRGRRRRRRAPKYAAQQRLRERLLGLLALVQLRLRRAADGRRRCWAAAAAAAGRAAAARRQLRPRRDAPPCRRAPRVRTCPRDTR